MTDITIINVLEKAENVMCIYRNFINYNKTLKALVICRIVVEICIYFAVFINNQKMTSTIDLLLLCHFVNFCNVVILVICGILTTVTYKVLKANLSALHSIYNTVVSYKKSLARLHMYIKTFISVYLIVVICLLIIRIISHLYFIGKPIVLYILILIVSEIWYETRFILERAVLYAYITVLYSLLKCLNKSISRHLLMVNNGHGPGSTEDEVKQWAQRYQHLVNCVKLLSACFQSQMTFSVATTTVHYIGFAYGIFSIFLTKEIHNYAVAVNFTWVLFCYFFSMHMVFYAGQALENEAAALRRVVSKLQSLLSAKPKSHEMRIVKDFKLFTTIDMMKIEFAKSRVGMYLTPMILSLTISYVIIALQFNNVI